MAKNKRHIFSPKEMGEGMHLQIETPQGKLDAFYALGQLWMTKKMMAKLYGKTEKLIAQKIEKYLNAKNIDEDSISEIFELARGESGVRFYQLKHIEGMGTAQDRQRAKDFFLWAREFKVPSGIHFSELEQEDADTDAEEDDEELIDEYFGYRLEQILKLVESDRPCFMKVIEIYALAVDFNDDTARAEQFMKSVFITHAWLCAKYKIDIDELYDDEQRPKTTRTTKSNKTNTAYKTPKISLSNVEIERVENSETQLDRLIACYLEKSAKLSSRKIFFTVKDWDTLFKPYMEIAGDVSLLNDIDVVNSTLFTINLNFEKFLKEQEGKQDFNLILSYFHD